MKNLLDDIERARAFKLSSTIKVQLEQAANQNVEKVREASLSAYRWRHGLMASKLLGLDNLPRT